MVIIYLIKSKILAIWQWPYLHLRYIRSWDLTYNITKYKFLSTAEKKNLKYLRHVHYIGSPHSSEKNHLYQASAPLISYFQVVWKSYLKIKENIFSVLLLTESLTV